MWTLVVYEESENCFDEDNHSDFMVCRADCTLVKCETFEELQQALASFRYAEILDKYGRLNFVYHIFNGKDLLDVVDTNEWNETTIEGKSLTELFNQARDSAKEKIREEHEARQRAVHLIRLKQERKNEELAKQEVIAIEQDERAQLKALLEKYGNES